MAATRSSARHRRSATVSDELTHDLGADPNEIVSISIGSGSTADNTAFSVVQTAAYGERFGRAARRRKTRG